jgi:hypothetical protein
MGRRLVDGLVWVHSTGKRQNKAEHISDSQLSKNQYFSQMKKPALLLACLGLVLVAQAQVAPPPTKSRSDSAQSLPLVRAQAQVPGERYVTWQKPKPTDDGPDCWILCECSDTPQAAETSSTLRSQGKNNYGASLLLDDDPTTAWVEGQPDHGIGATITLTNGSCLGYSWNILNGYQKNPTTWEDNSRIKKLKVLVNGQPVCTIELLDIMGAQSFRFSPVVNVERYDRPGGCVVTLVIEEVYSGRKYKDTALSAIYFSGC